MKRIDFKKGSATFIFGYFLMLTCLVVVLVLVEQYAVYNNAEDTQMAVDAVADGTAVYATTLYLEDEASRAELLRERVSTLRSYLEDETNVSVESISLDEEQIADSRISIELKTKYSGLTQIESAIGTPAEDSFYYILTRTATTSFNMMGMTGTYYWPINYRHISDGFTIRNLSDPAYAGSGATLYHPAIDISAPRGTPFYAAAAGKVVSISTTGVHPIIVEHGKNQYGETVYTRYVHGDAIPGLTVGQTVAAGQQIGTVNNHGTGAYHLDFGCFIVRENSSQRIYKNVLKYLYHLEYDGTNNGQMAVDLRTVNNQPILSITMWHEEEFFRYSTAILNGYFTSGEMY